MSDVKITVIKGGPYKVEGQMPLFDPGGDPVETREDKPYFLCRCGKSSNKPFCDGSHKTLDFDG